MTKQRRGGVTVLHRSPRHPWAMFVMLAVLVVIGMPLIVLLLAVAFPRIPSSPVGGLLLVGVVVIVVTGLYLVVSHRQSFTVTTSGLEVRSHLSTRRIPWSQVRRIQVGPATFWAPRATEVVLTDGRTIRPLATSMRFALWRGESPLAHGRDGTQPTRDTQIALDAHRRYLAGEFGRS